MYPRENRPLNSDGIRGDGFQGYTFSDYLRMLRQRRWIVVLCVEAAIVVTLLTLPNPTNALYRASINLEVQEFLFASAGESAIGAIVPDPVVGLSPSEVQAARSYQVAAQTAEDLGQPGRGASLLNRLSASGSNTAEILKLTLVGDGRDTLTTLRTYATNYIDYHRERFQERVDRRLQTISERLQDIESDLDGLEQQLEGEESPGVRVEYESLTSTYGAFVNLSEQTKLDAALARDSARILGPPTLERLGGLPERALRLVGIPLAGLLIGCASALALGVLRPLVGSREGLENRIDSPVLAVIPRVRRRRMRKTTIDLLHDSEWAAEGILMLRTQLELMSRRSGKLKAFVITSPQPRDGKSTISNNLAAAFVAVQANVALVHADVHAGRSLGERMPDRKDHEQMSESGNAPKEPSPESIRVRSRADLSGPALRRVISDLVGIFEVAVVDTAPFPAFSDSLLLAQEAESVVLVARADRTREDKLMESLELLRRHEVRIAGVVLNDVRIPRREKRHYRYYFNRDNQAPEVAEDVKTRD